MTGPAKKAAAPARARGRGRPVDHLGDDTRAGIVAVAQRLFGEAGFKGVSVEALAAQCGLNARALYYYFPTKRAMFDAAVADALTTFGHEVAARVFVHPDLRARVQGYVDVYRFLNARDPLLLAVIGRALVESLSDDGGPTGPAGPDAALHETGELLRTFIRVVVDDAFARGEIHPGLDRDGATLLLTTIGMGLALASLDRSGSFPAMLDALDRLGDGTLFAEPLPGRDGDGGVRAGGSG